MPNAPELALRVLRTSELDDAARRAVVELCVDAHDEEDFRNLFTRYLPPDALHVLASSAEALVGHAVATTRWLQPEGQPVLRTAYVDAVATSPARQREGIGSAVMRQLALAVAEAGYEVACLETERVAFYERLGWAEWPGPLAGRSDEGLIPTPEQRGVMILRLPRTPELDPHALLTIEVQPPRIW